MEDEANSIIWDELKRSKIAIGVFVEFCEILREEHMRNAVMEMDPLRKKLLPTEWKLVLCELSKNKTFQRDVYRCCVQYFVSQKFSISDAEEDLDSNELKDIEIADFIANKFSWKPQRIGQLIDILLIGIRTRTCQRSD